MIKFKIYKALCIVLVNSNSSKNVSYNHFIPILVLKGFKTNKEALLLNRFLAVLPSEGGHASKSEQFHVENC